jgi:outer membrane protein assembly factor BamB
MRHPFRLLAARCGLASCAQLATWCGLLILTSNCMLQAEDWPQWMGPHRDGVVRQSGLIQQVPAEGLKVLWRAPVAGGYAGPAVADGRVFVADYVLKNGKHTYNSGGRDELEGTERVLCFDAATGKPLWNYAYERPYYLSYGTGPRATPTVDGDRVYALGAHGDLTCLTVSDGKPLWKKQLAEVYAAEVPQWGYAAHPLVHGDLLICLAGGEGSVAVALNKHTGEEVWKNLTAGEIGYCPPTLLKHPQGDQLLIWHADALNGLEPLTGKLLWTTPLKPSYGMSIAAPRYADGKLFASGIGEVGAMYAMGPEDLEPRPLWRGKTRSAIYQANATAYFDGQTIYGSDCGSGLFVAVDAATGNRHWETYQPIDKEETRRVPHGTTFVIRYGDRFYLFNERGEFIIAKLTPEKYEELGRAAVLQATSQAFGRPVVWSHPAVAQGCLFARNDQELVCVSLRAEDYPAAR